MQAIELESLLQIESGDEGRTLKRIVLYAENGVLKLLESGTEASTLPLQVQSWLSYRQSRQPL
jgi:hypothetical protein